MSLNQNSNSESRKQTQIRQVSYQLSPSGDISERNLSNDLRQLVELDNKSLLISQNPQQTQQNTSKIEKEQFNNTGLAKSQLIQIPIQKLVQQQQLRLSSPVIRNQQQQQANFIQNSRSPQNIQMVQQSNPVLRSSLPPNSSYNKVNNVPNQYSSTWVTQPSTTQGRVQSNYQSFNNPLQIQAPQANQIQGRPMNYLQTVQHQPRPNSVSPQKITFNYHSNQREPSPSVNPHPSQTISRPINTINIPQNPHLVPVVPAQQQGELVIWQQRYFIIFSKFEVYYKKLQIIHQKYLYLDQAIGQTKPEQIKLLKAESQELLLLITQTQQELTQTIHTNRQIISESTNWKLKYEQLLKAFQNLKQSHTNINKDLLRKVDRLDKQLLQLQTNYHMIVKKNEEEVSKNKKLESQLQSLNNQLKSNNGKTSTDNHKQFELQLSQLSKIISDKNETIEKLKKRIESKESNNSNQQYLQGEIQRLEEELIEYKNLINQLKAENDRIHTSSKEKMKEKMNEYDLIVQKSEEKINKLQTLVSQYQQRIRDKDNQLKRYQSLLESKNTQNSNASRYSGQKESLRSSEFQIQNRRLKHQLTVYQQSHSSDLKMFNAKIQQLVDKIKMMGTERDSTVANLQEKAVLLESDLNKKDGTIRNLRDRILELQEQKRIKELDKKYEPKKQDSDRSKQINHFKKELNDRISQIQELESQLSEYKRLYNEQEDSLQARKHEIKSLKRQIEQREEGLLNSSQLNETLVKKNEELIQAQNKIVQLQKLRNQNELLRQENNNLSESLRKKHIQLSESTDRAYLLEKKIRELQLSSENSPKLIHLTQQYELLENAINKKDQQIVKLRQNNQLLQSNINELQIELQKAKNRLNSGEKNSQSERGELKGKLSVLELKIVQYQRKIIGLQQVRVIMTQQINTLTSQIHLKFQNLQRVQMQLKQERLRSKAYQNQVASYISQAQELKNKLKQWEKKYQILNKQFENEKEKKKDLTNTKKNEIFNLNNRCVEFQNSCKVKDLRIKELQKNIEGLNSKIRNFDHNLEEIQYLKHKISQYQHKINYQNQKFTASSRLPDLEPTQIFERKVIYQLKVQNQSLRKQLGLAPKPQGKQSNIPERDSTSAPNPNVNQRLNDFNKRLQDIISEHVTVDYNLSGDELYKRFQRDRRLLIQKHNEDITQLKVKILELQGQTHRFPKKYNNFNQIFNEQLDFYKQKNQQLEQRVQNHIRVNRQLKENLQFLLKSQNGDHSIVYYKQQLQKSSETIVNLQKQLKKANQELRKIKEQAIKSSPNSHIEPNYEAESKVSELARKISQLTLQINLLQKDRVARQQAIQKNDSQVKRLKMINDEIKSSRDELQRLIKDKENTFQDQISKTMNRLRINQSEVQRLNELLSKRQGQQSNELKALRGKVADLQEQNRKHKTKVQDLTIAEEKYTRQIAKLQGQIQILLAETHRLKQVSQGTGKRHRQTDIELQSLHSQISDYEGKLKALQSIKQSYNYKQNQLHQQIARLSNQVRLLQSQIQRMNDFTQKKVSEKDSEINRLKLIANQRIDEISRLQDQIRELKLYSFKSNETAQEIFNLKQEINGLKISYNLKNNQCENRLKEIYELNDRIRYMEEQTIQSKRVYESKTNEFQSIINSLQIQLAEGRKIKDSSSSQLIRIQTLQDQLRSLKSQKEQEYVNLSSKISSYQSQIRQIKITYESQLNGLRQSNISLQQRKDQFQANYNSLYAQYQMILSQFEEIKRQLQARGQMIRQLQFQIDYLQKAANNSSQQKGTQQQAGIGNKYSLQFLRSVLIEIQVLVKEQGGIRAQALSRIERSIQLGLQQCRIMNEGLAV